MCSEECFVSYDNNNWNVGTPLRSTYPATPPSISRYDARRELVPEAEKIWSRKELLSVTSSCDRFIPNRRLVDNDLSNFLLRSRRKNVFSESLTRKGCSQHLQPQNRRQNMDRNQNNIQRANDNDEDSPPTFERFHDTGVHYAWSEKPERKKEYRMRLIASVVGSNGPPKVLNLSSPIMEILPGNALCRRNFAGKTAKAKRFIPRFPEKILDLPRISDAYGSNVVDWNSSNDYMAVGLETSVYIWHPITKHCLKVPVSSNSNGEALYDGTSNVTAVAWNSPGTLLAMSMDNGEVVIWDKVNNEIIQTDYPMWSRLCHHQGATVSLVWRNKRHNGPEILYLAQDCECLWRYIINSLRDIQVEVVNKKLKFIPSLLKLSSDERYLACCGDTGLMIVLDIENSCSLVAKVKAHEGVIKAMAWCPWQRQLIATGGSTRSDKLIRVWNVNSRTTIVQVDAKASVCALVWSEDHKELISGHDGELNYVHVWSYPSMEMQFRLVGHKSKILYLGIGLNKSLLATISEDETLLLWRCFDSYSSDGRYITPKDKKRVAPLSAIGLTTLSGIIR